MPVERECGCFLCGRVVQVFELRSDTWWNLDAWLAEIILAGLEQYIAAPRQGFPIGFFPDSEPGLDEDTDKLDAWEESLQEMRAAFALILRDFEDGRVSSAAERRTIEKGLQEFARCFCGLWD